MGVKHCCSFIPVIYGATILLLLLLGLPTISNTDQAAQSYSEGALTPYLSSHGPRHRSHRDTQLCQSVKYANVTHTKYPAKKYETAKLPLVETHYLVKEDTSFSWSKKLLYINQQIVNNPLTTWSVLEPHHPGTCQNGSAEMATVEASAQQKHCIVAANAGFFNTHTGQCLGNIVSDGFLVQDSHGVQNVHFGVTKDGYLYTGYLSELDLVLQDFRQLVGGVVWLVRDGVSYVDESKSIECPETEETGSVERFINVVSGRAAVGHDAEGRIHMVQVMGKTDISGVNLYQFADFLVELGLINAINLDGGGSVTTVINGTLASFPTDQCPNSTFSCPRLVSTIQCVHEPSCFPSADCSGNGICDLGVCSCRGYWAGKSCNELACPSNCSQRGNCTEDGCRCRPGWHTHNCSVACGEGWYGINCSLPCSCGAGSTSCDSVTGVCQCPPGYTGRYCQSDCPVGYFGVNCQELCACNNSCGCDPVTGSCNMTLQPSVMTASTCVRGQELQAQLFKGEQQYSLCLAGGLAMALVLGTSLFINLVLVGLLVSMKRSRNMTSRQRSKAAAMTTFNRELSQPNSSSDDEEGASMSQTVTTSKPSQETKDSIETETGDDEEALFLAPKRGR